MWTHGIHYTELQVQGNGRCGKRGHISRTCPAKINSRPSSKHQRQPAQHRLSKTHALEKEVLCTAKKKPILAAHNTPFLEEGEDATLYRTSASPARAKALMVEPTINGTPIRMDRLTPGPLCRSSWTDSIQSQQAAALPTSVVLRTNGTYYIAGRHHC